MLRFALLLLVLLTGCTRTLHSFEYTHEVLPPHPSSLALQQQVEVVSAGQTLRFEAALESTKPEITYVIFSSFGPKSLVLRERDYILYIEKTRLYNLPFSALELSTLVQQFISAYVHSRTKDKIELRGPHGEQIKFISARL